MERLGRDPTGSEDPTGLPRELNEALKVKEHADRYISSVVQG